MIKEISKSGLAIAAILLFVALLCIAVRPFINGIFGALILYVLFSPFYNFLVKKNIGKKLAALIIIFIATFIILIPIVILLTIVAKEVVDLTQNPGLLEEILALIGGIANFLTGSIVGKVYPSLNFASMLDSQIPTITSFASNLILGIISELWMFVANLLILYFTFYYLLTQKKLLKELTETIPFSKKNSQILIQRFKDISFSTVVVSGIIAVLQGFLLGLSFFIFGVKGALFWGFIATILSFIPMVGSPIIWLPTSIILLSKGNYTGGIGILAFGVFLSTIDNIIRPFLQKKVGNLHPLVTLIGVFMGLSLFGLLGLIIGPLIITYVLLTLKMFKEEYLD
jgi:predicted PurR-regulated permease PerM